MGAYIIALCVSSWSYINRGVTFEKRCIYDVKTDVDIPDRFQLNEDIRERLLQAHASESTDNRDGGIRRWLSHIGLEKYAPNFLSQGYDDLDVIGRGRHIRSDLNHIGIQKPGHRKKLKVMAKKIPRDLLRNSDVLR